MKAKKFASLMLAVMMVLTMLTACCGGGSSGGVSLSLSEVNDILSDKGCSARVISDSELDNAVKVTAAFLRESNTYTSEAARDKLNELVAETEGEIIKSPGAAVISDAALKKGTELNLPGIGQTGTVDSAEEFVALTVQMMVLLAEKTAENPENIKYAASATTVKADDGTVYWLIVVEAIANREDLGI